MTIELIGGPLDGLQMSLPDEAKDSHHVCIPKQTGNGFDNVVYENHGDRWIYLGLLSDLQS